MNLTGYLANNIWAMLPAEIDKLKLRADGFRAEKFLDNKDFLAQIQESAPSALATRAGERLVGTRYASVRDGIAVIDIQGAMFTSGGWIEEIMAFYFGGTSTKQLARDIQTAIDNPGISAIVLNINSPGGEAFGINELSNLIYKARSKKTVESYIYGYGASAALFAAVGASKVTADPMAMVGSIGVVAGWADFTGFYENLGIAYEEVTSENAPFKRLDIRKPEERAVFMSEINGMEKVFIDFVAKARGVKRETVIQNFGQGATMAGWEAVKVGLIDETGDFESVISKIKREAKKAAKGNIGALDKGDIEMGFKEDFKAFATKLGFKVTDEAAETPDASTETPDAETENAKILAEKQAAEQREKDATAELEQFKANAAKAAKAQVKTDAENFVSAEIKAGRLYPSEKESAVANYCQAAEDDENSPLATGSRVENLKLAQSKRKSHGLTEEQIDADANRILFAQIGGDGDGEKEVDALLKETPLGRAALKNKERKLTLVSGKSA